MRLRIPLTWETGGKECGCLEIGEPIASAISSITEICPGVTLSVFEREGVYSGAIWNQKASKEQPSGMTSDEKELVTMLGECWNRFIRLGSHASNEQHEFMHRIHDLQRQVMSRVAERAHPDIFPPLGAQSDPRS